MPEKAKIRESTSGHYATLILELLFLLVFVEPLKGEAIMNKEIILLIFLKCSPTFNSKWW